MKIYISLFLGLLIFGFSSGQTTLEYHLKVGEIYTIHQNAEQIISQTIGDTEQIITNTIEGEFQLKVINKQEDQFVLELKFDDLKLHMSSNLLGEILDVKAKEVKEDDFQSKMYHSLLNSPVKLFLQKNGAIVQVTGGEKLVSKMTKAADIEDEFSLEILKTGLENEFGSAALSESYEQMTFLYPSHEITVGDTWTNEYQGKLQSNNHWTLKSLTGSHATISGKAEVSMSLDENTMYMQLYGHQETEIKTNLSHGFLETMEVTGVYSGISKDLGSNEEIPTKIKSHITYKLINTSYVQQNF